jgi:deoxyribonuclease II
MIVSPLDEQGKPVDWWFLYKVPKLTQSAGVNSATGYEYLYFDPSYAAPKRSAALLNSGHGALDLTLAAVFSCPAPSTGWILYNDELPDGVPGSNKDDLGHTKGVIAFDVQSNTAFWLLHSWPKYPVPGTRTLPTPMFGQTFLCVALSLATAKALAAQMVRFQQPQSYLPRLPRGLPATSSLRRLTQPLNPRLPGASNQLGCKTRGGQAFQVFAKNRLWGKDFWSDLVGPGLHANMDDETWIRGPIPPILDSDGIYKTFDIKFITLHRLRAPWAWPETKDHAKWGITTTNDWVCAADINRMISQEKRGGGGIALQNHALWSALSKTDLLVRPPGHTLQQAKAALLATHTPPNKIPGATRRQRFPT